MSSHSADDTSDNRITRIKQESVRLEAKYGIVRNDYTIIVGAEASCKSWVIPRDLLARASTYFERMTRGPWIEDHDRTIRLPDVSPPVFFEYLRWLDSGHFCCRTAQLHDSMWILTSMEGPVDPEFAFQCWIFGEYTHSVRYRDLALKAIHASLKTIDSMQANFVFEGCHPDSHLYRYMCDYIIANWDNGAKLVGGNYDLATAFINQPTALARIFTGLRLLSPDIRPRVLQPFSAYSFDHTTSKDWVVLRDGEDVAHIMALLQESDGSDGEQGDDDEDECI